jgi:NADH dehydrogenase
MTAGEVHVVTGAFGYTGQYIARRLLAAGHKVRTLTNSSKHPDPFAGQVEVHPLCFDDLDRLTEALRGAAVLYNTYWVRFDHKSFSHGQAVANTLALFDAVCRAGVQRIVHVSITNPSEDSPLPYFSGKAELEKALIESGLSYAILRPAVVFGEEDILIHNIAWFLRRFPVFGVFGDGRYRLQPVYVDDLARLAVEEGVQRENHIIDAIGPETFTYRELVDLIGQAIGKRRPILSVSPTLGWLAGVAVGSIFGDVVITRNEIKGLMADLLCVDSLSPCATRLSIWAAENGETLGVKYQSELARRCLP